MKMVSNKGVTSISVDGKEYEPNSSGVFSISEEHVPEATLHGLEPYKAEKAEKKAKADAPPVGDGKGKGEGEGEGEGSGEGSGKTE